MGLRSKNEGHCSAPRQKIVGEKLKTKRGRKGGMENIRISPCTFHGFSILVHNISYDNVNSGKIN